MPRKEHIRRAGAGLRFVQRKVDYHLYSSLEKNTQRSRLQDFLDFLEQHLTAARAFFEEWEVKDERADNIIELYQDTYDETLLIAERLELDQVTEKDWNDLAELRDSLNRALARYGQGRWVEVGPTNSRRLNQMLHALTVDQGMDERVERGPTEILLEETLALLKELELELVGQASLDPLISFRKALEHSRLSLEDLYLRLDHLSRHLDLAVFDREPGTRVCWIENFQNLLEAVELGEVDADYLLRERSLALQRIEALLPLTVDSEFAPPELPEILVEMVHHLKELEASLKDQDNLDDWLLQLQALWHEMEDAHQRCSDATRSRCTICANLVPAESVRCPVCQTPVLKLDEPAVKVPQGGTGATVLDEMVGWWSSYQQGELSPVQLNSRMYTVQFRLEALRQQHEKSEQNPPADLEESLEEFYQTVKDFGYLTDERSRERGWEDVLRAGLEMVRLMQNDE